MRSSAFGPGFPYMKIIGDFYMFLYDSSSVAFSSLVILVIWILVNKIEFSKFMELEITWNFWHRNRLKHMFNDIDWNGSPLVARTSHSLRIKGWVILKGIIHQSCMGTHDDFLILTFKGLAFDSIRLIIVDTPSEWQSNLSDAQWSDPCKVNRTQVTLSMLPKQI